MLGLKLNHVSKRGHKYQKGQFSMMSSVIMRCIFREERDIQWNRQTETERQTKIYIGTDIIKDRYREIERPTDRDGPIH